MKRVIKKLTLFLAILCLLLVVSSNVNSWFYENSNYKVPGHVETIITGSSLVTNGINPNVIDSAENIGLAAEPLALSYYKLKDILPTEPQVKNVVVSYSLVDVAFDWDNSFNDGKKNTGEMMRRLLGLRNRFSVDEVKSDYVVDWFIWWEQVIRYRVFPNFIYWMDAVLAKDVNYLQIGGYNPGGAVFNPEKVDARQAAVKYFPVPDEVGVPIYGKMNQYVDSIVNICKAEQVEVFLIAMPVSSHILEYVNEGYEDYFKTQIKKYNSIDHVSFIDYTNAQLGDSCFIDFLHLNTIGADIISKGINERIKYKVRI